MDDNTGYVTTRGLSFLLHGILSLRDFMRYIVVQGSYNKYTEGL